MKINTFNNKRAMLHFERKMNVYEVKFFKSIINIMKSDGFKNNYLIYNESNFQSIFDEDIDDKFNYNDFLRIINNVQDNCFMLIDNNEYIRSHLYRIIYPIDSNNIILDVDESIFEYLKTKYQ